MTPKRFPSSMRVATVCCSAARLGTLIESPGLDIDMMQSSLTQKNRQRFYEIQYTLMHESVSVQEKMQHHPL
jgi:hypothetical protein